MLRPVGSHPKTAEDAILGPAFLSGFEFERSVAEKFSPFLVVAADLGSFDCVRRSPHFT